MFRASLMATAFSLAAGAALAQPAAPPTAAEQASQTKAMADIASSTSASADPWEHTNRKLYGIHQSIDHAALGPIARGYKSAVPSPARTGLRNAIGNAGEPIVIVNYILQAKLGSAARSFTRFVGNSVFGIGGFIDLAGKTGLPHTDNDFGVTLARYGVKSGPYVFVPLLGPSTTRDLAGKTVDIFTDPFTWIYFPGRIYMTVTRVGVGGIDLRAEFDQTLEQIDSTATDPYATLRSLYLQNRQSTIGGGQIDLQALPDFDDPGAAPPAPAPEAAK
ncbi:MAG: VacJ family lipoprotein [Caulobacteraceae bacterium]